MFQPPGCTPATDSRVYTSHRQSGESQSVSQPKARLKRHHIAPNTPRLIPTVAFKTRATARKAQKHYRTPVAFLGQTPERQSSSNARTLGMPRITSNRKSVCKPKPQKHHQYRHTQQRSAASPPPRARAQPPGCMQVSGQKSGKQANPRDPPGSTDSC